MLSKLVVWIAGFTIGRYLAAPIAWAHNKMDGRRTEIVTALTALVHILKMTGILPEETAKTIEQSLLAIIPVVLADKVSKAMATADRVAPKPPE